MQNQIVLHPKTFSLYFLLLFFILPLIFLTSPQTISQAQGAMSLLALAITLSRPYGQQGILLHVLPSGKILSFSFKANPEVSSHTATVHFQSGQAHFFQQFFMRLMIYNEERMALWQNRHIHATCSLSFWACYHLVMLTQS